MSRHVADLILRIDGRKFIAQITVDVTRDERIMGCIVRPDPFRYFMTDEYGARFVSDEARTRYERGHK